MDATLRKRLTELVDKATDKASSVEPVLQNQLKLTCRASEQAVEIACDLLLQRLRDAHAQVRLNSLSLCDELFLRSKAFRALLVPQVNGMLAFTVGHRSDTPLPGPAETASELRHKALEVLERWDERFGALYAEVRLAHRYLKDVLHLEFPELRARAAAAQAEAQQQQVRAQAIAQDKYEKLSISFDGRLAELLIPVGELERTFALLDGSSSSSSATAEQAAGQDADDWEDVQPEGEATEGLAAYAGTGMPDDMLSMQDVDPAIAESAQSTVKQLQAHCLPLLQDWLRIITKAKGGEPGTPEHARHNEVTHAAVAARSRISDLLSVYDRLHDALEQARNQPQHAGPEPAAIESDQAEERSLQQPDDGESEGQGAEAGTAAVMQDVFGSSDSDSDSGSDLDAFIDSLNAKGNTNKAASQQECQPNSASRAKAAASQKHSQWPAASQAQGQAVDQGQSTAVKQHAARPATAAEARPAVQRTDPARASKPPVHQPQIKQEKKPDPTARVPTKGAGSADQGQAAMSSDLKEKLLAQAPVMPSGQHLAYWDSDKARALVNARGLELSNHWGPVDAHKELSEEVLAQFFGTRASYYVPPSAADQKTKLVQAAAAKAQAAKHAAAQPTPSSSATQHSSMAQPAKPKTTTIANPLLAGLSQSKPVTPPPLAKKPTSQAATSSAAESSPQGHAHALSAAAEPQHRTTPRRLDHRGIIRTEASASGRPAASVTTRPSPQHESAATLSGASEARDAAARQRAEDRAHNAAILGQLPDAEVARNLAEADTAQARGRGVKRKGPQKGNTRMRLAKRLLTPKGTNAALGELSHVDSEVWREREGNAW